MSAALLIIGAPGAGKTAVLEALSATLEDGGTAHGALETEQLSLGYPPLDAVTWTPQLQAVLALQRDAGRELFLLTATVESPEELSLLCAAVGADRSLVACLRAPAEVLAARLDAREPDSWAGKAGLIARARGMAGAVARFPGVDVVVDTAATDAETVSRTLLDAMRESGLLRQRL
jgi:hypothetical protein